MKMLKMLIQLMVLVGVICLSHGVNQTLGYDDRPTPDPDSLNPSWMANIPDDRLLSEVSMPGTHDSMARHGNALAVCQTWTLASQLRAGVRFLDIRVRNVSGELGIYHQTTYQQAHFGNVLEDVVAFLREYPRETVLMRIKKEFTTPTIIYDAVVDYIHRYAHWDLLWHSQRVPTMAEARGKIIIMQEFSGPDLGMRYGSMDIADDWMVLFQERKWQSISNHLQAALNGDMAKIFLTFSSGTGSLTPRDLAQRINPRLHDYLVTRANLNQRLGIICTTWVYRVYPPDYTTGATPHCNQITYQFVTTLLLSVLTLMFICAFCFALLTCCKTVKANKPQYLQLWGHK